MTRTSSFRPSVRHLANLCMLALALPLTAGCGAGGADGEDIDSEVSELNPRIGCDYSWARPSLSKLKADGYTFVSRYVSYDMTGKNITLPEANALKAAGLDIVANWEASADDALDGYNRGVQHANEAQAQAVAAGMPPTRPLYFSVDFDATAGQQPAIDAYMDGVASVIGRGRTGAYGGYWVIKRLFDNKKITWGWQTYAWSGGKWDPRAQVRQTQNGLMNGQIDRDEALVADFGQWSAKGGGGNPPPPPADSCSVHNDGKLYCDNSANAPIYAAASTGSAVVNHLRTTYSWFDCWGTGEMHAGGNTTWYHTLGDDNASWGFIPAVDLKTPDSFDADPSAHGLKQCATQLPPLPADCNVHGDKKLYCTNTANTAMYKSTNYASGVVNHLVTSSSWFTCWATGEMHAGGNTTWYYTLGDANANWGFIPAVQLNTPSSFDLNATAYGLPHCN